MIGYLLDWLLGPRWFVEVVNSAGRKTVTLRARDAFGAVWKSKVLRSDPVVGYTTWKYTNNLYMYNDEHVNVTKL
jgi:hypothetical protein